MSGLPIMPAMPAAAAFQREAMPQAQPAPGQGVAATVRTLTSAAIQQAQAAQKPLTLPQQVLPSLPERRARLVGPPPTFDINVLQDIYETRKAPPERETQDPEMQDVDLQGTDAHATEAPHDEGVDPTPQVAQTPSHYASYTALRGLADAEDMAEAAMDRSV